MEAEVKPEQTDPLVASFDSTVFAVLPDTLARMRATLAEALAAGRPLAASPSRGAGFYQMIGSAAVLPVQGVIVPRASVWGDLFGGEAAMDRFGVAIDAAANDPDVSRIILNINSPGGYVSGTPEAAAKIANAARKKPVVAVAEHMAASAAYWLASQATELVVAPSGEAGSIGVLAAHVDIVEAERKAGIKTTLITSNQSPHKSELWPYVALSDDARADMQREVNAIAKEFIGAVAKGRGVTSAAVEAKYGGGRMLRAQDALAAGMVDRIASLETVLRESVGKPKSSTRTAAGWRPPVRAGVTDEDAARRKRKIQADLAKLGLPTA